MTTNSHIVMSYFEQLEEFVDNDCFGRYKAKVGSEAHLIEMAARAFGKEVWWGYPGSLDYPWGRPYLKRSNQSWQRDFLWNPFYYLEDAMELSCELKIDLIHVRDFSKVKACHPKVGFVEVDYLDRTIGQAAMKAITFCAVLLYQLKS